MSDPPDQGRRPKNAPRRGVAHAPAHSALRLSVAQAGGTKRRLDSAVVAGHRPCISLRRRHLLLSPLSTFRLSLLHPPAESLGS